MAPPDKTERLALLRGELAKLPADTLVVYADEVDIHLNPKSGPDWTPKGVRKTLVTPGQNAKRYVAARWISFRAVGSGPLDDRGACPVDRAPPRRRGWTLPVGPLDR